MIMVAPDTSLSAPVQVCIMNHYTELKLHCLSDTLFTVLHLLFHSSEISTNNRHVHVLERQGKMPKHPHKKYQATDSPTNVGIRMQRENKNFPSHLDNE